MNTFVFVLFVVAAVGFVLFLVAVVYHLILLVLVALRVRREEADSNG